jgi:uncharacterized membrane protein YadS
VLKGGRATCGAAAAAAAAHYQTYTQQQHHYHITTITWNPATCHMLLGVAPSPMGVHPSCLPAHTPWLCNDSIVCK